jgi:hypothetical protein
MGERVSSPTMRLSAARPAHKFPDAWRENATGEPPLPSHKATRMMREPRIMSAIQPNGIAKDDAPLTPPYGTPIDHPGAWKVADFKTPADYTIELGAIHLRDIERAMRQIKAASRGLDDLRREHFDFPSLRPVIDEIRHEIQDGRGFVVLRRLPVEDYSKDEIGMIFWGIGTYLGRGLSQSVLGDRLGHVKDFSREDPLARAYRNKQELSPARLSARRQVGRRVAADQRAHGPQCDARGISRGPRSPLPRLCLPSRGEEKPGDLPHTPYRVPVYSNTEGKVSTRYVRTYVEAGEAAAGHKMGEAELAVLDRFEEVTKRPELMLEFTLQPGEIYFINNYTILHVRTAFDDGDAEEDRRRHLLCLWLEVPQMRPVHPYPEWRHRGGARSNSLVRLEQTDQ